VRSNRPQNFFDACIQLQWTQSSSSVLLWSQLISSQSTAGALLLPEDLDSRKKRGGRF